jgi:hypothetical protein
VELEDYDNKNETPNIETIEAMHELESGGGHRFRGTTEQLFNELMRSYLWRR